MRSIAHSQAHTHTPSPSQCSPGEQPPLTGPRASDDSGWHAATLAYSVPSMTCGLDPLLLPARLLLSLDLCEPQLPALHPCPPHSRLPRAGLSQCGATPTVSRKGYNQLSDSLQPPDLCHHHDDRGGIQAGLTLSLMSSSMGLLPHSISTISLACPGTA